MGMFDEITCDYPLPDPRFQSRVFQTKSLDRFLDRYNITADGRLTKEGAGEESGDVSYTGAVEFHDTYDSRDDPEKKSWGWVSFIATFKDGKLIDLGTARIEPPS